MQIRGVNMQMLKRIKSKITKELMINFLGLVVLMLSLFPEDLAVVEMPLYIVDNLTVGVLAGFLIILVGYFTDLKK
jgi:hypothetical protein